MTDKECLKQLSEGKLSWTWAAIKQVKKLGKKGYAVYQEGWHCGFWAVTDEGFEIIKAN